MNTDLGQEQAALRDCIGYISKSNFNNFCNFFIFLYFFLNREHHSLFIPSLLSTSYRAKFTFELSSEGTTLTRENLKHNKNPPKVTECGLQGKRGYENDAFWR